MKKLIAICCFIFLFVLNSTNLWSQSENNNLSVYFVYTNITSVSTSQEAVKTLVNDFLNYPGIKKLVVLPKSDSKLAKSLKSDLMLDGVIVNENKNSFKGVNLRSTQDLLIFDSDNKLIQQYSNFSQIIDLLLFTGKAQGVVSYKFNPKDFVENPSIIFPVDDTKNGTINLIIPEEGKMLCFKPKQKRMKEIELPDLFDSYYYYGNTLQSKKYRDLPFKNAHIINQSYVKSFDESINVIKALASGIEQNHFKITSKGSATRIDSGLLLLREIDQDKIKELFHSDFYFSQNICLRVTARLNDSIMAVNLLKMPDKTNHLGLIDMTGNTMNVIEELDGEMNSDSLIYTRFSGDKSNKMYMLNFKSNELKIINFKSQDKPAVTKFPSFIKNNMSDKLLDIYATEKVLYTLFINPNNPKNLYIEEYETGKMTFLRGYTIDISTDEFELINLAGMLENSLCIFYKNSEGVWNLKSYKVL